MLVWGSVWNGGLRVCVEWWFEGLYEMVILGCMEWWFEGLYGMVIW
jgi:hypothetical protein